MPPMMKKRSFVKQGPPVIASYDYTDVAEGTGFRSHYLFLDETSAATAYKTTNDTNLYSKTEYTQMSPAQGAAASLFDHDFDIIFNLPQNVKGTAETQIFVNIGSDAGTVATCYLIVTIERVSGGVTTQLATVTTDTETITGAGGRYVFTAPAAITSNYH